MIAPRTPAGHNLRSALQQLLATGRAITTTELRTRLAEHGFPGLTQETVYRQLDTLARAGLAQRITHPGRRRVFWIRDHSSVSAQPCKNGNAHDAHPRPAPVPSPRFGGVLPEPLPPLQTVAPLE